MASQGPLGSGTQASTDRGAANQSWNTMANVTTANTSGTTATVRTTGGQTPTDYLDLTNFGFTIPSGATINGVVVSITRKNAGIAGPSDETVQLIKGGTAQGTNKATATAYTSSYVNEDHGGVADLWALTLTDSDINASTFGVRFAAQSTAANGSVDVDFIGITVSYTAAAAGTVRLLGTLGVGT